MKTMPRNIQMGAVGFIAGFIAIFVATGGNVILSLVVGAVIFGLFFMGIIKSR